MASSATCGLCAARSNTKHEASATRYTGSRSDKRGNAARRTRWQAATRRAFPQKLLHRAQRESLHQIPL
ncbi:hypothetical protein DR64_5754 [Paraburkholderia xenovorans LB400]|nr:hypothetical protein DR64_5754 [Paraburkholderia xenovorans LB400]